ncbi:MAG: ABC transporter permease subunit [Planctomycetes bacterium]|nr:ABC transporter permease subunit [Planctomycetota bacterium]
MLRWSVVRLIATREVRDQFRDKRTLFLILGLPVVMYPLFLGVSLLFLAAIKEKVFTVGVVGAQYLPQSQPVNAPTAASAIAGIPAALVGNQARTFPPLIVEGTFPRHYLDADAHGGSLVVKMLDTPDESLLVQREVDALLIIDPNITTKLERGEQGSVRILGRDAEENSKLAVRRLSGVLNAWIASVKTARFTRAGLPTNFDVPVEIRDPSSEKAPVKKIFDELRDSLAKTIPFLLVMWMLTGAIYPAIDMTAGEKERGTMETLLISPAERIEIVMGKFVAVVMMGFGTAAWNVFLMILAVAAAQFYFEHTVISLVGLAMCMVAALPLAMLIAASTLALGVFARSTKEGNYYVVPLFFVGMPLSLWSMSPGLELDAGTSWMPVLNALLLQQRMLAVRTDAFPWQHVPAVFITLAACIGLALWAAVRQFHRESVLFREAEASGGGWSSWFGRKK